MLKIRMMTMTRCLQMMLLMVSVVQMNERFQYYQNYRLEKLCPPDGRKVRMRLEDSVASFQLNSSLVPGHIFNCHLELVLDQTDLGFFVYFDSMSLNEDKDGDCEEDYVQFGRDILFITSHRSNKYCGVIEGSLVPAPPSSGVANVTEDPLANVTPLGSRPKTLSLIVTPYKKTCNNHDRRYKRCGASQHCIRSELFCDGTVNCAVNTQVPQDENGCKVTTVPPVADTTIWEHPSLPHALGSCVTVLLLCILLFYFARNCWFRPGAESLPKDNSNLGRGSMEQQDLIHMDGLIVPVSRPRIHTRIAPPSYDDSVLNPTEQQAFQQTFTNTMGFTPQYSYSNREG